MTRRGVLFDVDRSVGLLVPDWRLVVPVHHHQLHLHVGVQRGLAAVTRTHSEYELGALKVKET